MFPQQNVSCHRMFPLQNIVSPICFHHTTFPNITFQQKNVSCHITLPTQNVSLTKTCSPNINPSQNVSCFTTWCNLQQNVSFIKCFLTQNVFFSFIIIEDLEGLNIQYHYKNKLTQYWYICIRKKIKVFHVYFKSILGIFRLQLMLN